MEKAHYEIISLPRSTYFINRKYDIGGNYLHVTRLPGRGILTIKFDSSGADAITLKEGTRINLEYSRFYLTYNNVAGDYDCKILVGQNITVAGVSGAGKFLKVAYANPTVSTTSYAVCFLLEEAADKLSSKQRLKLFFKNTHATILMTVKIVEMFNTSTPSYVGANREVLLHETTLWAGAGADTPVSVDLNPIKTEYIIIYAKLHAAGTCTLEIGSILE